MTIRFNSNSEVGLFTSQKTTQSQTSNQKINQPLFQHNIKKTERGKQIFKETYYPNGQLALRAYVSLGGLEVYEEYHQNGQLSQKTRVNTVTKSQTIHQFSQDGKLEYESYSDENALVVKRYKKDGSCNELHYTRDKNGKLEIKKKVVGTGDKYSQKGSDVKTYDKDGNLIEHTKYVNKGDVIYKQTLDIKSGEVTSETKESILMDGKAFSH